MITRHGKEVAQLVPPHGKINREAARQAAQRIRDMSQGVNLQALSVTSMINEGRR